MKIAIFFHVGSEAPVPSIVNYLKPVAMEKDMDLYVNLCTELLTEPVQTRLRTLLTDIFSPRIHFFHFENRGCDIGPLFLCLDHLRKTSARYDTLLHLHTKTDDAWRKRMLQGIFADLTPISSAPWIRGAFTYPYDYYHYPYDLEHLNLLQINIPSVDWNPYREQFPEVNGIYERMCHVSENIPERLGFVPFIDRETMETLFGKEIRRPPVELWKTMHGLGYGHIHRLYYFPGNFLYMSYSHVMQLFQQVDFTNIHAQLEKNKVDDRWTFSRTHSWERVLPVAFQLRFSSGLIPPVCS